MQQIIVSVNNKSNDHCHFKRCVDLPDGLSIPFDSITSSLLFLFQGLNVVVNYSISSYGK